jgi:hypothetical protein
LSVAALVAIKPGQRPRLIYRTHRSRRASRRKGFTEADYAALLDAGHQQLGGPIVLVWDNLNTHLDEALGRGRVLRSSPGEAGSRRKYWIAFYNPCTGEVTVGRATDALVLGDGALLELPADGAPAVLARCGEDVTLHVEGRALTARTPTFAAHQR